MSRSPKKVKRHERSGVYAKRGWLYYTIPETRIINGKAKTTEKWYSTKLKDTPENRHLLEEKRKKECNIPSSIVDKNILLSDYCSLYLKEKQREIEDTTYATYRGNVNRIMSFLSDVRVRDIDKKMVTRFLDALFTEKHYMKRTVKDTKAELSRICQKAVEDGILVHNPVPNIKLSKTLAAKYTNNIPDENKVFNIDEALKFLKSVKVFTKEHKHLKNHVLYKMFFLVAFLGLRREEILGLKWSAINFQRHTMYIIHTVTKGTMVNRKDRTKTKTSKREYYLPDILIDIFNELKTEELYYRKTCGSSYYDSDYIFKQDDGTLFSPDYPSKIFKKILKENTDLPQDVTFHGLRSTCVSILLNYCDNPKEVQKYVGHSEVTTTLDIYNRLKGKESMKKLATLMASLLEYEDSDDKKN